MSFILKDLVISSFVILPCIYVYQPPYAYNQVFVLYALLLGKD